MRKIYADSPKLPTEEPIKTPTVTHTSLTISVKANKF